MKANGKINNACKSLQNPNLMKNYVKEKFSLLAPLDVQTRTKVAIEATKFFSPANFFNMLGKLNRPMPRVSPALFRAFDFVEFLTKAEILPDAMKCHQRIQALLDRLVATGILSEFSEVDIILGKRYCFLREATELESTGYMWLALALGPDFITGVFSSIIVHLTGKTAEGDPHAGTGIILTPKIILTCAHVIKDMELDEMQTVQGTKRRIISKKTHPTIDVGIVEVSEACNALQCLAFREPEILDEIYVIGFPRVPYTRTPAMITHRGEVTNPSVQALDGSDLFLFSAIARPGNSGGPIISSEGRILGLVAQSLHVKTPESQSVCKPQAQSPPTENDATTTPFFAGVPTSQIQKAVLELDASLSIPIENYIGTTIELKPVE
jgi:hypothetical protein